MRPIVPGATVFGVSTDIAHTSIMEHFGKLTSNAGRAVVIHYVATRFEGQLIQRTDVRDPATADSIVQRKRRGDGSFNGHVTPGSLFRAVPVCHGSDDVGNPDQGVLIPFYWWGVYDERCTANSLSPQVKLFCVWGGVRDSDCSFCHD